MPKLLAVLATGLIIRMVVGTLLTYGYDVSHWALVMSNISSGNGLYDLTGYFYTPVWGYILAFVDLCQQSFLTLGDTVYRVTGALGFEAYGGFISSNTTSLAFAFWVKLPLYLVDLLVACLVYKVVFEVTGDRRKAWLAFVLWVFNPLVICAPAVQGMFDNIAALLTIMCFLGLRKRMYFLSGAMLGLAMLLKLFPVFLLPLAVAYVLVREDRDLRRGFSKVVYAMFGFVLTVCVIFLPQILDGTVIDSFSFLIERAGAGDTLLYKALSAMSVLAYSLIVIGSFAIAWVFYKKAGRNLDRELLSAIVINLTMVFLYPPTPQYLILLIPFLTVYAVTVDRRFTRPLFLICIAATGYILANNFTLLLTFAHDTGIISVEAVVSWSDGFQPMWGFVYHFFGVMQSLSILYLAYLIYRSRFPSDPSRRRSGRTAS